MVSIIIRCIRVESRIEKTNTNKQQYTQQYRTNCSSVQAVKATGVRPWARKMGIGLNEQSLKALCRSRTWRQALMGVSITAGKKSEKLGQSHPTCGPRGKVTHTPTPGVLLSASDFRGKKKVIP